MAAAALIVSIFSVLVAVLGFLATRRSAGASERSAGASESSDANARRSADAAESTDRRARLPNLSINLDMPVRHPGDLVIYRVRNDGPEDLDAVTIYRPRPPAEITYPLAVTGDGAGWAADEITLGPLRLAQEARFTLCCGAALVLPEFRVRIECRAGTDIWKLTCLLPTPRLVQLTADERASRRKILMSALLEIEHNVALTVAIRWRSERPRRSRRHTTRVSPARRWSRTWSSWGRRSSVPLALSVHTRTHPAAVRASAWMSAFWSVVLTLL